MHESGKDWCPKCNSPAKPLCCSRRIIQRYCIYFSLAIEGEKIRPTLRLLYGKDSKDNVCLGFLLLIYKLHKTIIRREHNVGITKCHQTILCKWKCLIEREWM